MNAHDVVTWAEGEGIDRIGWFSTSTFPRYLQALVGRPQYQHFRYRSWQTFVEAGQPRVDWPMIIVIAVDYFADNRYGGTGFKLSNYSRFCAGTLQPRVEHLIAYLTEQGYRARRLDVPGRAAACRAGLGSIGKNCMFYAHGLGSYVGIEAVGTDLELAADRSSEEQVANELCEECQRCIDACPTQAIDPRGYRIDPFRCLSFVSRHPDEPRREMPSKPSALRRWLHGCEICQDVCPLNRGIDHQGRLLFRPEINLFGLRVPNQGTIPASIVRAGLGTINSPGYREYVIRLLAGSDADADRPS